MHRYELEDRHWALIADLFPPRASGGRPWPARLAADRGYNAQRIRAWLARRGVRAVIPTRRHERPRPCDRRAYRQRNVVERCVGRLKECRRVATRYEKLAVNFAAMVTVAMIVMYLRLPL
jgi:transposase